MSAASLGDGRPVLLVLRALRLGDLLVAVPALHALHRAFPEHRLVYAGPGWLVDAVALVDGFELLAVQGIDEPIPVAPGSVDIAVNLHGRGPLSNSRVVELDSRISMMHGAAFGGPPWREAVHERERWTRLLNWYGIEADPLEVRLRLPDAPSAVPAATVIHAGAGYGSRLWPPPRFSEVARSLAKAGHTIVFTGSAGERERALRISREAGLSDASVLAGGLSLAEFAAVIADARLVVSADTGAAHLASAYHRPSVVLFGPARPDEWGPPPGPHIVLERPERRRGDPFADDPDPALLGVSVGDVLDAAARLDFPESGLSRRC